MTGENIDAVTRRYLAEFGRRLDARLITREDESPYLWRGYLLGDDSDDKVNAFLHRFVSSDLPGELHCHPWSESISIIQLGEYREIRTVGKDAPEGRRTLSEPVARVFRPGDCNVISANTFHRVELLTTEVWTLFIHGPRVQPWGFVKEGIYGQPLDMRVIKGKTSDNNPKGVMVKE